MARAERQKLKKRPQPAPIPVGERRRPGRQVTPLLPVDEGGLGPAMLALNPAQRAFVAAKVLYGLSNTDAAEKAGYSSRSPHALETVGSRLAHDDRIQAAILEEGQKLMRSEGPKSVHTLVAIRDDKTAAPKDRLKAATELLDRSGFHSVTEHNVSVEHRLSDEEKDRRMLALCAELGMSPTDAQKLLIAPSKAQLVEAGTFQDAEFEEVHEPTEAERKAAAKRERDNELRRARKNLTPEERRERTARTRKELSDRLKAQHAARAGSEGLEDLLDPLPPMEGDAQ
jgi:phage terminase small subunit